MFSTFGSAFDPKARAPPKSVAAKTRAVSAAPRTTCVFVAVGDADVDGVGGDAHAVEQSEG